MSLGLRGETIISQWIHPSMPPSCPGAPWATPNTRTLQPSLGWNPAARPLSPPWSLRGAAGSDSSYRASIQSEIKPWWENTDLDGQTDRWMEGQWCRYMETWRTGMSRPSGGGGTSTGTGRWIDSGRVSLDNGTFLNFIKLPGSSSRIWVPAFGPSNLSRFCEKGTCGRGDWPIQQLLAQQTHKHTPEGSSAATKTPSRVLLE